MQDGALAQFGLLVRNHLNEIFGRRWIGRGGPVTRRSKLPDLTPVDFNF